MLKHFSFNFVGTFNNVICMNIFANIEICTGIMNALTSCFWWKRAKQRSWNQKATTLASETSCKQKLALLN